MKTNFYKKLLLVMIASVSVACSNQSGGGGKTSGSPQSSIGSPQSSTGSPQPSTENANSKMSKIPDSLHAAYSFTAEECNNRSPIITVISDKIFMTEGIELLSYVDINSVTYQDGDYNLEATLYEKDDKSTNNFVVYKEGVNMLFAPNSQNSKAEFTIDGETTETLINCDKVIKADKK